MSVEPNLELWVKNGDKDLSGNNNSLTNNGAIIGNGMEFDGNGDIDLGSIPLDDPLQLTGQFTISFWMKPYMTGDDYQRIIDKSTSGTGLNGYCILLGTSDGNYINRLAFDTSDGVSSVYRSDDIILANEWQYIVFIQTSTTNTFYHNGQAISGSYLSGSFYKPPNAVANMKIGDWQHVPGDRRYEGELKDVKIYSEAKSAAWVSNYYNLTKSKYQPIEITNNAVDYLKSLNPKGLWIPPAINDVWKDYSGNNNDGTPQNVDDIIYETNSNGPISSIGSYNEAIFGGNDGYIDVGDKSDLEFSTAFTAILLMKLPDWSANRWYFFGKYNTSSNEREWIIEARGDMANNPITVGFGDPSSGAFEANAYMSNSTTLIDYDTWFVLGVTYNAGTVGFYVNGSGPQPYTTAYTIPSSLYNGSANFQIATLDGGSGYETPITIAFAAVYDFAWTSNQISYLQNLINI